MKQENKINANDLFHNVIKRPHAFRESLYVIATLIEYIILNFLKYSF